MRTIGTTGMYAKFLYQRLVTANTVFLNDVPTALFDLNRFVEILKSESLRVSVTVLDLGQVFAQEIDRHVAIVAGRDIVMRRLEPPFVLVAHDVAIDTRPRIVGEVRRPFSVLKRVRPHSEQQPHAASQDQA